MEMTVPQAILFFLYMACNSTCAMFLAVPVTYFALTRGVKYASRRSRDKRLDQLIKQGGMEA